jgi:transcriptional regulator with XRE-family HTH domain
MSDSKRQLAKEFAESREYRESYAEGFANDFITTQMKLLRKQRGLSQAQLGDLIESNQGRISVYENKEYGQWNVETLRRVACTLGCWLKVSMESYGTLLDEADRFSAAELLRPAFEDDPVVRRWLRDDSPADDPFAPARRLLTDWLTRDTSDFQPLCDWLQGIGLPGFAEGEQEFQWILWSLPEGNDAKAILADRLAALIADREIDVRPIGWRPEALLRNLFMLAANLGQENKLQGPLDRVYLRELDHKREFGDTRMRREALAALRTAMERNQADSRWEKPVWMEFVREGRHPFLPGAVQAGIDRLIHLQPKKEDLAYWTRLAGAVREVELRMYREDRVAPGKQPDVIDELKNYIGTILDYWSEPWAATWLLKAALSVGWMPEALSAWSSAVLEKTWDKPIRMAPAPLRRGVVINTLFEGVDYESMRNQQAPANGGENTMIELAKEHLSPNVIRLAEAASPARPDTGSTS